MILAQQTSLSLQMDEALTDLIQSLKDVMVVSFACYVIFAIVAIITWRNYMHARCKEIKQSTRLMEVQARQIVLDSKLKVEAHDRSNDQSPAQRPTFQQR